jgi:hypothetical protein
MGPFQQLYDRHALRGFEKQLAIHRQIGDWDWNLDLATQTIQFSKRKLFSKKQRASAMQVLGVEQTHRNAWEWAMEGEWLVESLTPAMVARATELRGRGVKMGIEAFGHDAFELDDTITSGAPIAIIAIGEFDLPGFYAPALEQETLFFLLEDPSLRDIETPLALRITDTCNGVLAAGGFGITDMRLAVQSYLEGHGLAVESEGNTLVGRATGLCIRSAFGANGRLERITAEA